MIIKFLIVLCMVATGDNVQQNQDAKATFYVAAQGNDAWSGRLAAPNAENTDGPFATLARARDALRQAKATLKQPPAVMVRGGKYFLDRTLVLDPEDSGTRTCPITYMGLPG